MPTHFEDQSWYLKWKEAVERVVEAQMARDGTKPGTPEREAAPGWRSREGALTHPGDHSWEAWSEDLATQQLRQLSDIRRNAPGRGHRKKVVVITRAKGL